MDYDVQPTEGLAYKLGRGYWKVNNRCYFNKMDCLRYATQTKNFNITYHFFDSAYSSIDWTKEPSRTLDELYAERAKQLRDKYDYIILSFSGGADSTHVLETFLENDIHIDEIVSYYPVSATDKLLHSFSVNDKSANNSCFEWYMACKPKLDRLSVTHPKIKITLLDFTEKAIQMITEDRGMDLSMGGISMTPHLAGQYELARLLKHHSESFDKVCCVTGHDKPTVVWDPKNNRFGSCFHDFANIFANTNIGGYRPVIEPFYRTPDLPEIVVSQTRAISRQLSHLSPEGKRPPELARLFTKTPFGLERVEENSDPIKRILYKNFNPQLWQAEKPNLASDFDQTTNVWIHNRDLTSSIVSDYFQGQLREWYSGIDDRFIKKINDAPAKFVPFKSKIYWV